MDLNAPTSPAPAWGRAVSTGTGMDQHAKSPIMKESLEPLFEPGSSTFEGEGVSNHFAQIKRRLSGSLLAVPTGEPVSPSKLAGPKMSVFLGNRCTRVHFVRHAEGDHNVVTRKAGQKAHAMLQKSFDDAFKKAKAGGKSDEEAQATAKAARTKLERVEENRPVHFATEGADEYTDAVLTEAGRNQCYALRGKMDRNAMLDPLLRTHIDLVVVSPLRRCLETAEIIFGPARTEQRPELKPFIVHDLCRERYGEFYCDKRRPMSENRQDPCFRHFDWETQEKDWPSLFMPFTDEDEAWQEDREPEAHVHERAMQFLNWLAKRPEQEVAVVTHSSFLKNLFKVFGGDTSKDDQDVLRAVPANCELRTVVLCHHG